MVLVDKGESHPEALIVFLDRCFEHQNRARQKRPYNFSLIENDSGNWTIGFHNVPEMLLVLNIHTFFQTERKADGLAKLIFNCGTPQAVEFENVAGCLAKDDTSFTAAFNYARLN